MAKIKSLDRISEKWKRVASGAQAEYEEGVKNPRVDWAEATAAAEQNYEQGVQQAISQKSFGKGVKSAGTAKWQKNAIEKGPQRFAQGVQLSEDNYKSGFAPFRTVIENTTLPPRGPKGDPKNIQRVAVLAKNLHDEKIRLRGQ